MKKTIRFAPLIAFAALTIVVLGSAGTEAQSLHVNQHAHSSTEPAAHAGHGTGAVTSHVDHHTASRPEAAEHEAHGHFNGHSDDMMMVHGSATLAKLFIFPHQRHLESAAGKQIHVVANGSATGLIDLVNGNAEVAMVSGPVSDIRRSLERESPGALRGVQFTEYPIGATTATFVVHPSNPVQSMSEDQMRAVLFGKITNWKELGGLDQPIIVFVTKPGDGARSVVEMTFLNGEAITSSARRVSALQQILQIVSQLPNGIGLSDGSVASDQVVTVSGVAIEQPLSLVTTITPTESARRLTEMASKMAAGL